MRRYDRTKIIGLNYRYGTSQAIPVIRTNVDNGNIAYTEHVLQESERLDILAGEIYGDSSLYWVIAAASGIGNALQVVPGTEIKIPNISDVARFLS